MPVPVKRRYTWWRTWKYAKEDIRAAMLAQYDEDTVFATSYEFIMPIAAELVRLQNPELDGLEFDSLVNRVGWALLVIPKRQYHDS